MSLSVLLIFIVALVFSLGFLLLVFTLIPAIHQLKSLLGDLEKTSMEVRDLARDMKRTNGHVGEELDKLDCIMDTSKQTAEQIGDTFRFVNRNILARSASFLAFIPAIKFGWKLIKKIKGEQ